MWSHLPDGVKYWIIFVCPLLALLLAATGCSKEMTAEQKFVQYVGEKIVVPIAEKAIENGIGNMQVQAGAQAIEPGSECELEGYWVTGIKGRATLRLVGASGQFQISAEAAPPQAVANQPAVLLPETDPERVP